MEQLIIPITLFSILFVVLLGILVTKAKTDMNSKPKPELRDAHYALFVDEHNNLIYKSMCAEGLYINYDNKNSVYKIKMYRKLKGGWFNDPDETKILKVTHSNYSYKKVPCDK
ncbi:MAG: hypothetical protein J6T10_11830 [Methanobrevibacter sp.]|nr:hypothetical protein [Methanobrevibacter sp.]